MKTGVILSRPTRKRCCRGDWLLAAWCGIQKALVYLSLEVLCLLWNAPWLHLLRYFSLDIIYSLVNGLKPGVSIVWIMWSSGWGYMELWKELLLVTDVFTTWRWLMIRLSKRQSPTTVLFRTTLLQTITLDELSVPWSAHNCFARVPLLENCLFLRTYNICRQISEHIFARK